MKKCKSYKKYTAQIAPTCGCDYCRKLWITTLQRLTPYERWLKTTPKAEQTPAAAWNACRSVVLDILEDNFTTIYDTSDEYCYSGEDAIRREAHEEVQKITSDKINVTIIKTK